MGIVKSILFFIAFMSFAFANHSLVETKDVSVRLQWKHQFEFAGLYMAKEKGYYRNINLNVSFKEWSYGTNSIDELLKDKSQYAVARTTSLIDIAHGKELIFLSSIYQSSPLVILADKSSNIKTIHDFKNRKIMITQDHINDPSIASMFSSHGIKLEDMIWVQHSFDVKDLLNKKADLMVAYASNEPFVLKESGGKPVIFSPKDFGFDFYNNLLVVSQKYLKNNPNEVRDFRNATLNGFKYAFENIDETVEVIYNKYNTQNKSKEALKFEALELKKTIYDKLGKIGTIDVVKLEKIYDTYKLLGLSKGEIKFHKIIYNDLLNSTQLTEEEEHYLQKKKVIKFCIDPDWMPFDKVDIKGNHVGMGADYLKILAKNLSVKFNMVKTTSWTQSIQFAKQKKCDILSLSVKTKELEEYFDFTAPYIQTPVVAVTKLNIPFINSIQDLQGKRVGMAKGNPISKVIKRVYKNLDIVDVKNVTEGLQKTRSGELFAFMGTLPVLAHGLHSYQMESLKISGRSHEDIGLQMGISKGDNILFSIMQKSINNITDKQKREILNRWVLVKYESYLDYSLVWKIIIFSLIIFAFFIYWNRKISLSNTLLKDAQDKIKKQNEELQHLATTDKLTQLYNRAKIDELLENEIARNQRYGHSFGITILDIDYFKNINDTYGHQVGDKILVKLSNVLKHSVRKTDFVGRWGGEEFLIIFPETTHDTLLTIIQNIKQEIKKHVYEKQIKVTVSFGCTIFTNNDTLSSIVQRADNALYKAKENGRDQIIKN